MDILLEQLSQMLGMDPATLAAVVFVVYAVCQLIGRLIPDDATGVLGVIRKICKVFGLYVSNRITRGVSVNDVAREQAGTE